MTTTTVSTSAELRDALTGVSAGDEILLAPGDYGALRISGAQFSGFVTIRSADRNEPATFEDIIIEGSRYLRIDGVHVDSPSNGSGAAALVRVDAGSRFVEFMNSEVNGKVDNDFSGYYGLQSRDSSDVRFINNYVHDVKNGGYFQSSERVVVEGNDFDRIGNDAMKFAGVEDVLIENNFGPRIVTPSAGAHLDFIQFQGSDSNGIVIRGNVVLPATPYASQGIFLGDATYDDVLIEQNIIYSGLIRAISVGAGDNVVARNNTTLTVPDYGHKAAAIILPDGAVSENNIMGFYRGGYDGPNLLVQWDDPNDGFYYDDVFVNASVGWGVTIEDLAPVPGGPADFGSGFGAEARLAELLDGGPGRSPTMPAPPPASPAPPAGSPPVAEDDFAEIGQDKAVTIRVLSNDRDPDGDDLSLLRVGDAANGTVEGLSEGEIRYTPDTGFVGTDTFTYGVGDGTGEAEAAVTVTVTPTGDREPVDAPSDGPVLEAPERTEFDGRRGDVIEFAHERAFAIAEGTIVFAFETRDLGGEQGLFSKDAAYWQGGGNHVSVYLDGSTLVARLQDAREEALLEYEGVEPGRRYEVGVSFGPDGARLHVDGATVASDPIALDWRENGQFVQVGGLGWGSQSGAPGVTAPLTGAIESFAIVPDVLPDEDIAAILAMTTGNNAPPEPLPDIAEATAGVPVLIDVLGNDGDQEGDDLFLAGVGTPANGLALPLFDGRIVYRPDEDFSGADTFSYTVSDGTRSASAEVSVSVSARTGEGAPIFILTDPLVIDGDPRSVVEVPPRDDFAVSAGTLSLSFEANNVSGHHGLVSRDASHYAGGGNHFAAYLEDGELVVRFQDGDGDVTFRAPGMVAGRTYEVVANFGDAGVAVWLDGDLVGSPASFRIDWRANEQFLQIGATGWASGSGMPGFEHVFDGTIFDMTIRAGQLDPAELGASEADPGASGDLATGTGAAETLRGSADDDFLWSGGGDDRLIGWRGRDELLGDDGADTLRGMDGDDVLRGQAGDDILRGDAGDDLLLGGDGIDKLFGQAGDDTMTGGANRDVFRPGSGDDLITDFEDGIDLVLAGDVRFRSLDELGELIEEGDIPSARDTAQGLQLVLTEGADAPTLTLAGVMLSDLNIA